ncbi:MAG: hypothetical protein KDA52_01415 [Planctomycetaceae bacterium]|nr:hypothetical protein [Planctomycetaceae bacterium]
MTHLLPLLDGITPVCGKPGHPQQRPDALYADRAYDSRPHRDELRQRGINPTWRGGIQNTAAPWASTELSDSGG